MFNGLANMMNGVQKLGEKAIDKVEKQIQTNKRPPMSQIKTSKIDDKQQDKDLNIDDDVLDFDI